MTGSGVLNGFIATEPVSRFGKLSASEPLRGRGEAREVHVSMEETEMTASGEQIGVAVQGAGTVSTEHLRAYLKNPHCRVVAIGSRTKEGAANKARQLGLDP